MADAPTTIGFVGLGHMGGNMAARFLGAGYRVYGTNRTRERARGLIEDGLHWRERARTGSSPGSPPARHGST
jgi:3-hydroxyisobutyrate dehydrogenase-like beta-hydroxyacid dehydrogenase